MLKVLFVYQHLPHYRKGVFLELEKSPGWEVHFAAGRSSRDPGIETISMTDLQRTHELHNIWVGPFLWQRGLLRLLWQQWDVIVFLGDGSYVSTWIGATMLRIRRIPVAFWTIGWHRAEKGLRKSVRIAFYRLADHLLLYGEDAHSIGRAAGYPASRMSVVGNSVSPGAISETESGSQIQNLRERLDGVRYPAVGAVIRFNTRKRLDLLIHAADILRLKEGRRVSVVLAGEGPERESLRALADGLDVDLHFLGPLYGEEALTQFYARCLVTVVPSLAGLTTLQSLHFGRPVITHDDPERQVPEYRAIRRGQSGDLYRANDVENLATLVSTWIEKVQEAPEGVAAACRASLMNGWTPATSADRILTVLGSLQRREQQVNRPTKLVQEQ